MSVLSDGVMCVSYGPSRPVGGWDRRWMSKKKKKTFGVKCRPHAHPRARARESVGGWEDVTTVGNQRMEDGAERSSRDGEREREIVGDRGSQTETGDGTVNVFSVLETSWTVEGRKEGGPLGVYVCVCVCVCV
jgi:hypothetical protein